MRKDRQIYVRILCGFATSIALLICSGCKSDQGETIQEIEMSESAPEQKDEEVKKDSEEEEEKPFEEDSSDRIEEIYVYVCGKVVTPGVYRLQEGDRVCHAIEAAGGLTDGAAGWYLNQAEKLSDGMKIYVPDEDEASQLPVAAASGGNGGRETDKINLNTATKEELMTLTGIGESKAESILRYREEHGAFQKVEEIQQVEGIKAGTYEKIKDRITVT